MRIPKDLQDQRNALRTVTQRKAVALLQEVDKARQAAAAAGDKETVFYLQDQIKSLAEASTLADFDSVNNFEIAWNKRKQALKAEAEKAHALIQPPSDPVARLNAARKLQARKDKA